MDFRSCAVSAAEVKEACSSAASWACITVNRSGGGSVAAGGVVVGGVGAVGGDAVWVGNADVAGFWIGAVVGLATWA